MKPTTKMASVAGVTHEGGRAASLSDEQTLRRSVLTCLLWEDNFYEDGESVHERITRLCGTVAPDKVGALAVEARQKMKLRHVPLVLCRELARRGVLEPQTLAGCLQRPDEPGQFLALLWDGKPREKAVPHAVRKGIALALARWNEYSLAKWGRQKPITLRDVLRLVRPKPADEEQSGLWHRIVKDELTTPDTWEVALSGAGKDADKKEIWTRLLEEKKLPAMALLRNLRNMEQAGIPKVLVKAVLERTNFSKVLPFRFLAAARVVPQWEDVIEAAMLTLQPATRLPGKTVLLVDGSGSMRGTMSAKSDITRMDGAAGLAILAREACEEVVVYVFRGPTYMGGKDPSITQVPPRRGMALRDALGPPSGGTPLGAALLQARQDCDRLLVFTDEQAHDDVGGGFGRHRYLVNVGSYERGVGRGDWTRLDGFSEAVLDWIACEEHIDIQVAEE